MPSLRLIAGLSFATLGVAVDVVGSNGCSTSACVLANNYLRFGNGAENSVNAHGLFNQPFYFSQSANTWYKLTYSTYPLDTAIGTGTGGPNWSGTNVVDLYSLSPSGASTDYSNFTVSGGDASRTVGYGSITTVRSFTISGQIMTIRNQFILGENATFVKVITTAINGDTSPIQNALIWVGTRDDFVGTTDSNIKTRGNLVNGQFVAVSESTQSSYAIMITNDVEGVLFYSETVGVMTAYALCCSFSNVYNTYPLSLAPATPSATDGSYAAVLPIGTLNVGASSSITWYYAAGAISSLSGVVEQVAENQQQEASPSLTPTISPSSTMSASVSASASQSVSGTPTASVSGTPTASVSASASQSISGTPTASVSASASQSVSGTPTASVSGTPTASVSASASQSVSGTPTASVSGTPTASVSASASQSVSGTPTASVSGTPTASVSASASQSVSGTPTASVSGNVSYIVSFTVPITSTQGVGEAGYTISLTDSLTVSEKGAIISLSVIGFIIAAASICFLCVCGKWKKYTYCKECWVIYLKSEKLEHAKTCPLTKEELAKMELVVR
jgi:hypothetical protein